MTIRLLLVAIICALLASNLSAMELEPEEAVELDAMEIHEYLLIEHLNPRSGVLSLRLSPQQFESIEDESCVLWGWVAVGRVRPPDINHVDLIGSVIELQALRIEDSLKQRMWLFGVEDTQFISASYRVDDCQADPDFHIRVKVIARIEQLEDLVPSR